MPAVTRHREQTLRADPSRVVARLFLPPADLRTNARAQAVLDTVLRWDEEDVDRALSTVLDGFADRHLDLPGTLRTHAAVALAQSPQAPTLSPRRELLLGAIFTAEHAVEGAALCNPSAVPHPDQDGVEPGQRRVALSLRAISEGHHSALEFGSAVVGPGRAWRFEPRRRPLVPGRVTPAPVRRTHLRSMVADHGRLDMLARAVMTELPRECTRQDVEAALGRMPPDLLIDPRAGATTQVLRDLVSSAYLVDFPADVTVDQQVLLPSDAQESRGMEDARFVQFHGDDGAVEYRAVYTAFDGTHVAPRLLTSPDLRTFCSTRLAGPGAVNKGMALFPRTVDGRHLALCRADGVRNSIASSADGVVWDRPVVIEEPRSIWQIMQLGNCGAPLETPQGWLVLTHGVGPMRRYSIGALLLDLEDPTIVRARLEHPLLSPAEDEQEGYVPNVVFSCGGLVHDGTLWVPYGIGDARVSVASVDLDELLGEMRPPTGA